METSRLTSKQKRTVFIDRFGERLFKSGFLYRDNRFVRVHPNEVCLTVSMQLTRNDCYICFCAVAMCAMINENIGLHGGIRVDSFGKVFNINNVYYGCPFEGGRFDIQYTLFFDYIFEHINNVLDVQSLLKFQNGIMFDAMRDGGEFYQKMTECIQLNDYEQAKIYIMRSNQRLERNINSANDDIRFYLETCHNKRLLEDTISITKDHISASIKEREKNNQWMKWIDTKQYDVMQSIISENRKKSNDVCRQLWPEFYK